MVLSGVAAILARFANAKVPPYQVVAIAAVMSGDSEYAQNPAKDDDEGSIAKVVRMADRIIRGRFPS